MHTSRRLFFATLFVVGSLRFASCSQAQADDLATRRQAADQAFAEQLEGLASSCDEQGLAREARWTRQWPLQLQLQKKSSTICVYVVDGVEPFESIATDDAWRAKFLELRKARARVLFQRAHEAAQAEDVARAMIGLTEVLREDPAHAEARRILGYVEQDRRWMTRYAARMTQLGNVWDDRFGWLTKAQHERYARGERRFGTRWMNAEQEARLRHNIRDGWLIRTDHYKLSTNHSLEEGVRLARELEGLHFVWRQVFAGYFIEPADLIRSFRGEGRGLHASKQHEVVYFRERDEYNRALRRMQPKIDITLGIYFDRQRKAYFFASDDQHQGTLYHEATHQLFQEIRSASRDAGIEHNRWIVEGIAAYMESLTPQQGYYTLGDLEAGRMAKARERIVEGGFYLPIAELVAMGMRDLQNSRDIAKIYTQAAGLATFLMHDDQGRYRKALVEYLKTVYAREDDRQTLSRLTGASYEDLDRQYHAFLKSTPDARSGVHGR